MVADGTLRFTRLSPVVLAGGGRFDGCLLTPFVSATSRFVCSAATGMLFHSVTVEQASAHLSEVKLSVPETPRRQDRVDLVLNRMVS